MVIVFVLLAGFAVFAGSVLAALAVTRVVARQLRSQAAADREGVMRATVDTVVAVAGQQLGQRADAGSRELDLHRDAIGQQLDAMGTELHRVNELVATMRNERAEQHGQLVQGLRETLRTTGELAGTTRALREALASPKARGQWGERMADDVLRAAGLLEGVNYRKQTAIVGGTIPDFTFLLPRGIELHMDVKFPVDNYVRHLEATTDGERDTAKATFLKDVRSRVKELAGRGYADPATTVGYLLLFIPNESVYAFIQENDRDLADLALGQRIVLCSPFTLFAVLGVVRQSVDSFLLERAGDEILDALGRFATQWGRFSEQVDKLGRQLATAQGTYEDLAGTRRRQLERRLDEIEAIRTSRGLPPLGEDGDEGPQLREVSSL
ncbi:MAG: recombination protein RmuC [Acidimicrobiaceae bacterium]|jgi:DNA recombination protein RmuC